MTSLKEMVLKQVIDMAWKTEGLGKVLKQKGDFRAEQFEKAQMIALWDSVLISLMPKISSERPNQKEYLEAYKIMKDLSEEFNYDSGKRKYADSTPFVKRGLKKEY